MVRIALLTSVCLLTGSVAAQAGYGYDYGYDDEDTTSSIIETSTSVKPITTSTANSASVSSSSSASRSSSRSVSGTASQPSSSASISRSVSGTASQPSSSASVSRSASSSVTRSASSSASSSSVSRSSTSSSRSRTSVSLTGTTITRVPTSSGLVCPSIPIETTTTSFDVTSTIYTGPTITSTFFSSPFATVSATTVSTDLIYVANTTSTVISPTITYTRASILPASTTVTVPTVAGFTPARCNPEYFKSTVTVRNVVTVTAGETTIYTNVPGPSTITFTDFFYTATTTSTTTYLDTAIVISQPVTTVYSTRADPTSTVYEACATNNIAAVRPMGLYFSSVQPLTASDGSTPLTQPVEVVANDPADCCSLCQGTANCAGSAWYAPDRLPRIPRTCTLFIVNSASNQTCSPLLIGEGAYGLNTAPTYFVSNSGCGQFQLF